MNYDCLISLIIARLERMNKKSYSFNSKENFDCELTDGNHFLCTGVSYENNKYKSPSKNLIVKLWHDAFGTGFVNSCEVNEETLCHIYSLLPREQEIRIEFIDEINYSGMSTLVGVYPTFIDPRKQESFLQELKTIMPQSTWEYDDVNQFVCYLFTGNKKQYLIASINQD